MVPKDGLHSLEGCGAMQDSKLAIFHNAAMPELPKPIKARTEAGSIRLDSCTSADYCPALLAVAIGAPAN